MTPTAARTQRALSPPRQAIPLVMAALLLAAAVIVPSSGWLNPACITGPSISAAPATTPGCSIEAPATGPTIVSGSLPGIMPRPAVIETALPVTGRAGLPTDEPAPPARAVRPPTPPPTWAA